MRTVRSRSKSLYRSHIRLHYFFRDVAHSHRSLSISVEPVRNVLLQHGVEVCAAEAKRAQAGAPHSICGYRPRPQFGIDVERRVSEIDIRIGVLAMDTG